MEKMTLKPDSRGLMPNLGGNGPQMKIEVSYRLLLWVALAAVLLYALTRLWPIVILVVVAAIFMAALLPYVNALVRRGLPRTLAVLLLVLGIVVVIIGLVALVVPAMIDQLTSVKDNLPEDARRLQNLLDNFGIKVELEDRARNIDWGGLVSGPVALDAGQRVLTTSLSVITTIVLTVYLLIDTPRLTRFFNMFVSNDRRGDVRHIADSLQRVVGGYVRGQVVTSLIIGVFTYAVLKIVGVPNPVAFGVLAAFADIVPLVGAFVAVIPATIAAFNVSETHAIIVLAALMLYQQFEDRFLVPRVYGQTLNLPPLIVLLAVLCGAELMGIMGVLLALPAAAAGRVAMDFWIERKVLAQEALVLPQDMDGAG